MSPVNWVNPLSPSTVVDKLKNIQQTKGDVTQSHAETYTLRQENVRQKKVTGSPDGEKVRMRRNGEQKQGKKRREGEGNEQQPQPAEKQDRKKRHKRIHLTV